MIQNIIFDFGGVFINLDTDAVSRGLNSYGLIAPGADLLSLSEQYEKGEVDSKTFLRRVQQGIPGSQQERYSANLECNHSRFPLEKA